MDALARQRAVARLAAAAFAITVATAFTPAAQAAGGGFSAAPAKGAPQDKFGTYFTLHAGRGEVRTETLVVSNLGRTEKRFLLDAVDGLTGTTTGTVYANRDDPRRKAGTWVTPSVRSVRVPPRRSVRIPFTVRVPSVARPGHHLAGLALQAAKPSHSKSQFAITQIIRVVVGVKVTVDGPTEKSLQLGAVKMEPLPGTKVPSVVVELANTGTLICKPILSVALTSPGGSGRTVSRQLDSVLPGTKVEFPLPWPVALDAGRYGVTATSKRCGKPSSVTTMAKLGTTLRGTPAAPDPAPPIVIVKHASIPWPALLGSTGLAALLGGFLVALVVRRRRPRPAAA